MFWSINYTQLHAEDDTFKPVSIDIFSMLAWRLPIKITGHTHTKITERIKTTLPPVH